MAHPYREIARKDRAAKAKKFVAGGRAANEEGDPYRDPTPIHEKTKFLGATMPVASPNVVEDYESRTMLRKGLVPRRNYPEKD